MTDEIREAVKQALKDKGLTQYEVARLLGTKQPSINRMLSGKGQGAGVVPDAWAKLLELAGLELTVQPTSKP